MATSTEKQNFQFVSIDSVLHLNRLCEVVNDWATKKGWNDTPDSVEHRSSQIALMHSELSECLEFIRTKVTCRCNSCTGPTTYVGIDADGYHWWHCDQDCPGKSRGLHPSKYNAPDDHVPSLTGESAELADVLIRIFHYCGKRGINLGEAVRLKHEYNITRPYRHGKVI